MMGFTRSLPSEFIAKKRKMPDLGLTLNLANGLFGGQGHPTIASWVFQNLHWACMLEGRSFRRYPSAHNGIYEAIATKSPVQETSFRVCSTTGTGMANGMKKRKERHPMLLEYYEILHMYSCQKGEAMKCI